MGINKVLYGTQTVMDISDSTVTPNSLAKGVVAYGADGEQMVGAMTVLPEIIPVANGGTGSANGAEGLANLFAAGYTVLSSHQYGDELPEPGIPGRIFFKKV